MGAHLALVNEASLTHHFLKVKEEPTVNLWKLSFETLSTEPAGYL